ncbi:MAG: glycoside hydrolase family 3 protein [Candidatus Limnocylindria bacterium]
MPTDAVLGQLLLAFDGTDLPEPMARRLLSAPAAGVTLFRYRNVASVSGVRELTDAIQRCAPNGLPFLVATDQEGGQLIGLGEGSTPFPGNMALGAVGDPALAERVGAAIGRELRAAGVNVNYAPVADLATNPANPSLGVRSFGDDPAAVAGLVAAFVRGLEGAGVAATLKHFPGKGHAGVDTHHELATVRRSAAEFEATELTPFRAGMEAGASAVMSGHFAAPALSGHESLPSSLAPRVLGELLRDRLGFAGLAISDAFDMDALAAGPGRAIDAIAGLRGGLDLLLLGGRSEVATFDESLVHAAARGLLDPKATRASLARITALRRRVGGAEQPDLSMIGCAEHRELAHDVACRALTLVRDEAGLLPLRPDPAARILVVMPQPADLTPADTSSTVSPGLAAAVRRRHPNVTEHLVPQAPSPGEIAAARELAAGHDLLVVGTISASLQPEQAELVRALLATGTPAVTAALRTPWDITAYPEARTHVCSYSLLGPSLDALGDALFGAGGFSGSLPVVLGHD